MKNSVLILLASLGIAPATNAQHLFIEAYGTYQLPIGGMAMSESKTSSTGSDSYTSKCLNFGEGMGGGLVLGRSINDHIGWEARFTYLSTGANTFVDIHTGTSSSSHTEFEFVNHSVRIEPAMRFTSGQGSMKWYVAVGPSLALFSKLTVTSDDSYSSFDPYLYSSTSHIVKEYKGRIGWGGFGALGFVKQGAGRVGFFAEVNCTAQSWSPAKSEETEHTEDGLNVLSSETISERETEYENEFTTSTDTNKPSKQPQLYLPMSSFGVRVGLRIDLGK